MLACACGRAATEVDCTLIVSKSVELEMRELHKPTSDALAKRQDQVKAELSPRIRSCIGRRVTDSMIGCVATATTGKALEACLQ